MPGPLGPLGGLPDCWRAVLASPRGRRPPGAPGPAVLRSRRRRVADPSCPSDAAPFSCVLVDGGPPLSLGT
eukprot:1110925-Alexandrium_andersonii.AAC.1